MVITRSKAKQVADFEREANEHKLGSWNQFEANKDLVQGVSTYEEGLYTTPIDMKEITWKQEAQSKKIWNQKIEIHKETSKLKRRRIRKPKV